MGPIGSGQTEEWSLKLDEGREQAPHLQAVVKGIPR